MVKPTNIDSTNYFLQLVFNSGVIEVCKPSFQFEALFKFSMPYSFNKSVYTLPGVSRNNSIHV